jgi:hypothetical protein
MLNGTVLETPPAVVIVTGTTPEGAPVGTVTVQVDDDAQFVPAAVPPNVATMCPSVLLKLPPET